MQHMAAPFAAYDGPIWCIWEKGVGPTANCKQKAGFCLQIEIFPPGNPSSGGGLPDKTHYKF